MVHDDDGGGGGGDPGPAVDLRLVGTRARRWTWVWRGPLPGRDPGPAVNLGPGVDPGGDDNSQ